MTENELRLLWVERDLRYRGRQRWHAALSKSDIEVVRMYRTAEVIRLIDGLRERTALLSEIGQWEPPT